jgi:hypothetical protein
VPPDHRIRLNEYEVTPHSRGHNRRSQTQRMRSRCWIRSAARFGVRPGADGAGRDSRAPGRAGHEKTPAPCAAGDEAIRAPARVPTRAGYLAVPVFRSAFAALQSVGGRAARLRSSKPCPPGSSGIPRMNWPVKCRPTEPRGRIAVSCRAAADSGRISAPPVIR